MAGISQHCKTGDVVAFGESVGVASKALCGLTEAAGQVRSHGMVRTHYPELAGVCFSSQLSTFFYFFFCSPCCLIYA